MLILTMFLIEQNVIDSSIADILLNVKESQLLPSQFIVVLLFLCLFSAMMPEMKGPLWSSWFAADLLLKRIDLLRASILYVL